MPASIFTWTRFFCYRPQCFLSNVLLSKQHFPSYWKWWSELELVGFLVPACSRIWTAYSNLLATSSSEVGSIDCLVKGYQIKQIVDEHYKLSELKGTAVNLIDQNKEIIWSTIGKFSFASWLSSSLEICCCCIGTLYARTIRNMGILKLSLSIPTYSGTYVNWLLRASMTMIPSLRDEGSLLPLLWIQCSYCLDSHGWRNTVGGLHNSLMRWCLKPASNLITIRRRAVTEFVREFAINENWWYVLVRCFECMTTQDKLDQSRYPL